METLPHHKAALVQVLRAESVAGCFCIPCGCFVQRRVLLFAILYHAQNKNQALFSRFFDFYSDSAERCRKTFFSALAGGRRNGKTLPDRRFPFFPFPFSFPEFMTELPSRKRRTAYMRQKIQAGGGDAHMRHFVSNQHCFFCCKRLILQYSNSWHASCLMEAGILKTHQINHQKQRSRDYAGHSENDRKDT